MTMLENFALGKKKINFPKFSGFHLKRVYYEKRNTILASLTR